MCGLAFSGKTTLARAIVRFTGAAYVGLDEINRERGLGHGGEGLPVEEWERTHRLAVDRVERLMEEGATILVDDTSNLRFLRERFRKVAGQHDYDVVLVYLDVPPAEIRRRIEENASTGRRANVLPHVLEEHIATFEHPAGDEAAIVYTPDQPVDDWLQATLR